MIYKVYYQETKIRNPKEDTKSLYMEADSDVIVRQLVEENTPYNIEYVQLLDEKTSCLRARTCDFTLTGFNMKVNIKITKLAFLQSVV